MKKEYVNPKCAPVALLIEEDLLAGEGILETGSGAGYDDSILMAPKVSGGRTV